MVQRAMIGGLLAVGMAVGLAVTGPGLKAAPAATGADTTAGLWAELDGVADDILAQRSAEWIGDDAGGGTRAGRLDRLLDRAVGILAGGDASDLRARIAERRRTLDRTDAEIATLRAGMAALPAERCDGAGPDASWVARRIACTFGSSRTDQAERIAQARRKASEIARQIDQDKAAFTEALARVGVQLTGEQVDGLLSLATSADIVGAQTVYENLRRVSAELERATIAADESVEVARRYYGVHAVLLEVALHMHETFVHRVRDEHLPRLAAIEAEAEAARREAAALRARERDAVLGAQLDANVRALDLTLKAAELYRKTLEDQAHAMAEAGRRVGRQRDVAVNTWRTVRASADMLAMMNENTRAFDILLTLDLPPPRSFDNRQLEREFERLTDRLMADRS